MPRFILACVLVVVCVVIYTDGIRPRSADAIRHNLTTIYRAWCPGLSRPFDFIQPTGKPSSAVLVTGKKLVQLSGECVIVVLPHDPA